MGIQHNTLPFAAVQFHPESILTSPAHGMAILENALSVLQYPASDEEQATSGAELVGTLEEKSEGQLRETLGSAGLSTSGSKSEMVVRLALWTHKSREAKAGRVLLMEKSIAELRELKASLGLKGSSSTKEELLELLNGCLLD